MPLIHIGAHLPRNPQRTAASKPYKKPNTCTRNADQMWQISIDEIRLQKALSSSLLELRKEGIKCPSVQEVIGEILELEILLAKLKDFLKVLSSLKIL